MPEAPEVQNVLQYLEEELKGSQIERVKVTHPKLAANLPVEQFESRLAGQRFRGFHRLGKYLVFELDNLDLVSHLRMEGKFQIYPSPKDVDDLDENEAKHIHAQFLLQDGRVLCYRDTRKFGRMYVYDRPENWKDLPVLVGVGKDALDPDLNAEELLEMTRKRKAPIKSVLLDQSVIAGIGNIYADEILFESRISPFSVTSHLSKEDWQAIIDATRRILSSSIEAGGTTIRSFSYGKNHAGSYQDSLMVHGKEGSCAHCDTPIVHTRVGQRSTWYCPTCQKEK